ncbi:hypothetical protein A8B82_10095 [Sulfitobacter sp. EhC04]|uniref:hypothetical protein n=1 Tax=Sulfitobacter sp. EhC04 TaxID=1849168 RepID=UPI0007F3BB43|nr:hypothetical protein [Sulfitobacter sp. EhC04]OAN78102.1 hypothetical protein A8B82_10095 [Sulfitobacter sp. EhC04]
MSFDEALAQQPTWVFLWVNWLFIGAFVLPAVLLIWRASRLTGAVTLSASVLAGLAINWMYGQMGYVKLLGLPHVLFWTPVAIFLVAQARRPDMPVWPRRIIWVVLVTILISLAFDYVDVLRYILGERTPTVMQA